SQDQRVYDLIQKQIEEANKALPEPARINKFVNLYKAFDADDEELTRTSKLKRGFMSQRYKDIVETLYKDAGTVHLDMTITYEDGRMQPIKVDLRIQKVKM
ncbi:MAG: long-chain fatty acid--CoA ligase, partial [Deltaproteobacteria bacterium]|nr:long-chain fatty acid--CoA ligase [Deltaproteobacteria bacterium]